MHGSKVVGVIPRALSFQENSIEESSFTGGLGSIETIHVQDMHSRKRIMADKCSAFVSLPGGYGTFEELLEITTWSILGIHDKPVIVLNLKGFFDPLKQLFANAVDAGFVASGNKDIVTFCDSIDLAIDSINSYVAPETRFKLDWTIS
ncbi:LOG family protein [Smittium culicis]|uniref:LOG family protein n=1 Tax=Smittium culicis TaxID=133412 RepID=A0A1R1YR76_9FUNG|nr:LOG family protein [Smittium culicis]